MSLHIRMWLLVALMFAILYGVIVAVGGYVGVGGATTYLLLAFLFLGLQYWFGPALVTLMMRVQWVSQQQEPQLHQMVAELAEKSGIPKPRIGISEISVPNAFAFGRTRKDGRVCVTQGIRKLLNQDELKAVLGHEIAHIKHRDMMIMTLLSVIPLVLYWVSWSLMWGRMFGGRRQREGYAALIGLGALVAYFVTNLLVLYGSRIREYYADRGSVEIGNQPHHLATALYKLVIGSAQARRNPAAQEQMRRIEGVKAFFLNDISRAGNEVKELKQVDQDLSGTIDSDELMRLRSMPVRISRGEKLMEIFTTHPNMLKRIKHLSAIV